MCPFLCCYLLPRRERRGILLCLRNDEESASPPRWRDDLAKRLASIGSDVCAIDTIDENENRLPIEEREWQLQKLLDAFRGAEVAITDRLHGMVFSTITGTPCVVFRSSNHKIRTTYDAWLSTHDYIKFQDDFDLDHALHSIQSLGKPSVAVTPPDLTAYYDPLRKAVVGQA